MVFGKYKNMFVLLVVKNSIFLNSITLAKIKRGCKFMFC